MKTHNNIKSPLVQWLDRWFPLLCLGILCAFFFAEAMVRVSDRTAVQIAEKQACLNHTAGPLVDCKVYLGPNWQDAASQPDPLASIGGDDTALTAERTADREVP